MSTKLTEIKNAADSSDLTAPRAESALVGDGHGPGGTQLEIPVDQENEPTDVQSSRPLEPGPGPEASLVRDGFAASIYLLVILTILQKGLGFVRSIVVCRHLEPAELGKWSMTLTFMESFVPFLILSIPACFGRYFEHFESRKQLKGFLRQSLLLIGICFPLGLAVLAIFRQPLARLIYGDVAHVPMVWLSLLVVIPFALFGVLVSILTGLRKSQSRTIGEFVNGVSFTALTIGLIFFGHADARSIACAFAGSYTLAGLYVLSRVRRCYATLEPDRVSPDWLSTWKKLTPAIVVFWISDLLTNLFFTVDRYMIINLSPSRFGEPLDQIGNYESAHVMPLLFSTFMAIVAKVLLPYLSKDWESGHRKRVSTKVNLSVKAGGMALLVGSSLFLWISGFLFDTLFHGKYDGGYQVLPWVVYFYVGSAMSFLLLNYFWCIEKGRFAIVSLIGGLVANILVNLLLIEQWGIEGAAMGTAAAVTVQLILLWLTAVRNGLRFDWRLALTMLAASTLLVSAKMAVIGSAAAVLLALGGVLFTPEERGILLGRNRASGG